MKRHQLHRTQVGRLAALASAALVVLVVGAGPASAQLACLSLTVVDAATPITEPGPVPAEFRVRDVVDLAFRLELPGDLSGQHVVELRVFTPSGSLYRSMSAPVAAPTYRGETLVSIDGYPRPMRVQLTAGVSSPSRGPTQVASLPLPVAGTDIVNRGIYGQWSVVAYVDGGDQPCTAATPFSLLAAAPTVPAIFSDGFESGGTGLWSATTQ